MFGDVADRKQAFLDDKNVPLPLSKKLNFSKGSTHDFSQKFEFFLLLFWLKRTYRVLHGRAEI